MGHYIREGRVRALGVSSSARTTQFPDIPAIAEFLPGYDFVGWVGCFVPAGTPRPIVDTLNAVLKKALEDREIASKLVSQTLDPLYATPEQFARRLQEDYEKYAAVVRISGPRSSSPSLYHAPWLRRPTVASIIDSQQTGDFFPLPTPDMTGKTWSSRGVRKVACLALAVGIDCPVIDR